LAEDQAAAEAAIEATRRASVPPVARDGDAFGRAIEGVSRSQRPSLPPLPQGLALVERWNKIAVDASGFDHQLQASGDPRLYGEQLGPARSSRAMAMVHIAMFAAANTVVGKYTAPVAVMRKGNGPISYDAAVAQAARDTLSALFTAQQSNFDRALADELAGIPNGAAKKRGRALGHRAATVVLNLRRTDGSQHAEPIIGRDYFPGNAPGEWEPDPVTQAPVALGGRWAGVKPFVLNKAEQFRVAPLPGLASEAYAHAYTEVQNLGGVDSTLRTEEQAQTGVFWAYDGTPTLCAPPRLYNQVALAVAQQRMTTGFELLRLLTLLNVAMADTAIAVWESKYFYKFWRPVTAIRRDDGNPSTTPDPGFTPLGAPTSNIPDGIAFTPPFPAYPSGHAGFGGALFQVLRRFYPGDAGGFSFVSDEFDGSTKDSEGNTRPRIERTYATFSEAEEENGQSRIYLGIHFSFDKTEGIRQGNAVADWVFDRFVKLK
jgi:hypothetical protein